MWKFRNHQIIAVFLLITSHVQSQSTIKFSDPLISYAVNTVDSAEIRQSVQELQDFGTRFMIAPNRKDVALSIKEKFESYNIPEVYIDSFQSHLMRDHLNIHYDTITWQYNVVARIPGSELADEIVLVGAHYDNVSNDSDPEIYAPGADDNASGIAALFETARVINEINYQPKRTIEFLAFAAEEMMYSLSCLSGSYYYADQCDSLNKNIICMINSDMIGYNIGDWEIGISQFTGSSFATNLVVSIAVEYTNLELDISAESDGFADCEPFWNMGIPSVYITETEYNPNYHSIGDTIGTMDFSYCTEMVKASIGSVIRVSNEANILDIPYINPAPNTDIKVFPNPFIDQVQLISTIENTIQSITIYDLKGNKVFLSKKIQSDNQVVDLDYLKAGYYLMEIQNKDHIINKKLIKY